MKCKSKLILFLIVFSVTLIPIAHAATLNPYPSTIIHLTAYDTYLNWTQPLTFDVLTVNATSANFTNVHAGAGSTMTALGIEAQNCNVTLTKLNEASVTQLDLYAQAEAYTKVNITGFSSEPNELIIDGNVRDKGSGWTWDPATQLITVSVPFTMVPYTGKSSVMISYVETGHGDGGQQGGSSTEPPPQGTPGTNGTGGLPSGTNVPSPAPVSYNALILWLCILAVFGYVLYELMEH